MALPSYRGEWGAGENDAAASTLGNMVLLAVLFGSAFAVFGFFFMVPLLRLFGVTPDTMALTIDYFEIILIACPIIILTQSISNAVRAEGNANVAMYTMLIGTVVNIGLDPLFIFGLGMGIRGAAIATLISISVTGLGLLIYFFSGRSEVAVGWRFLRFNKKIIKEMLAIGASGFAHGGAMSVTTTIIVNTLGHYGGGRVHSHFRSDVPDADLYFHALDGVDPGSPTHSGDSISERNGMIVSGQVSSWQPLPRSPSPPSDFCLSCCSRI